MAQTAEAIMLGAPSGLQTEQVTAPAAGASGQVIQLDDGRAGIVLGADASSTAYASGDKITVATNGRWRMLKTASIVLLTGGRAYWDRSANKVSYTQASGDFLCGKVAVDAASAAATVDVDLNVEPSYQIELGKGQWTNGATDGLGVTLAAEGGTALKLAFDAVNEAAMAALYSVDTVPLADLGVLEFKAAIYDIGDDAALDINLGLANGSHATDADSIAESCFLHLDGSALSILVESDDGTTEVTADDTTTDAEDDTYIECWMDFRDIDDVQVYINGVEQTALADVTLKLNAATGPLHPLFHIEKTTNDTTADVRIEFARMRASDLAL